MNAHWVFMPFNPGDVVMALHAVAQLRNFSPDAEVDFLTGEECLALGQSFSGLNRCETLPRETLAKFWQGGNITDCLREMEVWLGHFGSRKYGLALNFFQGKPGGVLHSFVDAESKSGLELKDGNRFEISSRVMRHLFAIPADRSRNPFHAIDLYRFATAEALRRPYSTQPWIKPTFALPPNPVAFPPQTYFAFHPGAAHRGKRWPVEHWARLAEKCLRAGWNVVWTGSAEESEWVSHILDRISVPDHVQQINLTGKTTLLEAASVYQGAARLVCGDTVAMHLAAAVDTRVLALFGPSNPVETGPYGKDHFLVQLRPVTESRLRFEEDCPELHAISPDGVAQLLLRDNPEELGPESVWRTTWEDKVGIQVLKDRRGNTHPFQTRAAEWKSLLQAKTPILPQPDLPPDTALSHALTQAQSKVSSATLEKLEAEERRWAEATSRHLVWEAYRIAANGLSLQPLLPYLRRREECLRTAYSEAKTLNY